MYSMNNITKLIESISDTYDALAIILVFTTVLSSSLEGRARNLLNKRMQTGDSEALNEHLKSIKHFLGTDWMFIFILNLILVYLLTPTFYQINKITSVNIFEFNVFITLYVFVYIVMLYFLVIFSITTCKLRIRIKELKGEIEDINK